MRRRVGEGRRRRRTSWLSAGRTKIRTFQGFVVEVEKIGTLTPQVEQEQPLQSLLQEQEEQEQGDMVTLVCW